MRFPKAALEAEGWRPRAPEPEAKPEPVKETPPEVAQESPADLLAPALMELAAALRTKQQPVVVSTNRAPEKVKGIKVVRNKDGLIDRFELIY